VGGGGGRCRRAGADAIMAMVPRSMMMGALCLAVERRSKPVDCGRVDDEQTNSVSFDTICLAFERRSKPVDCGRIDDEQTNSVSFDTICLAVKRRSEPRTSDALTTDRRIVFVLTQ
jgi:hypothetical protein